ncbi:MAG: DUF5606 domain-containing protein [Cytophagales bacterium]
MEFKEIAAVSGKTGLYRILKPTRNGVVLESLDDRKEKIIISSNTKVSILKDISMYTTTAEGNKPLAEIMAETKIQFGATLPVTTKSDDKALRSFFMKVLPEYDSDRVYTSDIKKMVGWYGVIFAQCPEVLEPQIEEVEVNVANEIETNEVSAEELSKPRKAASKKVTAGKNEATEAKVDEEKSKPATKAKKPKD